MKLPRECRGSVGIRGEGFLEERDGQHTFACGSTAANPAPIPHANVCCLGRAHPRNDPATCRPAHPVQFTATSHSPRNPFCLPLALTPHLLLPISDQSLHDNAARPSIPQLPTHPATSLPLPSANHSTLPLTLYSPACLPPVQITAYVTTSHDLDESGKADIEESMQDYIEKGQVCVASLATRGLPTSCVASNHTNVSCYLPLSLPLPYRGVQEGLY
jgi:hypothetical protein